jgi:hypothetical protein
MTRLTGMDLVDHILVTVHGRGYHRQCTAHADLHPHHASPIHLHMVWISPQDHHHSTLRLSQVAPTVGPTLPPILPFSRKTLKEETLHEIIFAGKVCAGMHRTNLTFNRGAPIPPSVGYLCLQSWLSNRAVSQNLLSKITASSHAPTNRVFQPSNDVILHQFLSHWH